MKFLPENKRKTIVLSIVFVVLMAAIVYLNFFRGRQGSPSAPQSRDLASVEGGLLPYGSQINIRILRDERFTILRPGPELIVAPEELGKTDLFSAP